MIALSCHITVCFNISSSFNNFSFSDSISLVTGIPVHFDTISHMSSTSTLSLRYDLPDFFISSSLLSISTISFSSAGISP
jgi:hypothetical protein